ncbi:MAG: response regulator [Candidatus Saccharibacteria bacterium]
MSKLKIVVVEDDALLAKHMMRTLQKEGYEVHHAAHAIDAIETIDEVIPDVIFLDILLIGSTGLVLLHELQSHADLATIPVIVCTNLADQTSLKALSPYGVRRVLDKATMTPDDIPAAVRSVLS